MKKSLILLTFFLSLLFTSNVAAIAHENPVGIKMIVGFEEKIDASVLEGIPYEINHIHDGLNAISITAPATEMSELRRHESVSWVEVDRVVKVSGQVAGWGYETTKAPAAADLNFTGEGIKVAVIDTGISTTHPDLSIAGGVSFIDEAPTFHDGNGHGTHVAGVIAAQDNEIGALGVAPGVELYAVKSMDDDGLGTQTNVIAGVEWAIENNMDIINLSITSPYDSLALEKALENAEAAGILAVAASGNTSSGQGQVTEDIMYPARYPTVIGVGAVQNDLEHADFSYTGESLALAAPGKDIFSTYITNEAYPDGYARMSGTSMAAPYVAGILALYKEVYPNLSLQQIKKIITGESVDLGAEGKDPLYGHGLVQAPDAYFWDLKTNVWYTEPVNALIKADLISGYTDGSFRPEGRITREEAVTVIGRMLELDGTQRETSFSDVKFEYFGSGYIASGTEEGFINGYPDNTFRPKEHITRGDMAVVIQKAFDIQLSDQQQFEDVEKSRYYFEAVNALNENNIITGYPDGNFHPEKNITRAEFAVILSKL